MGKAKTKETDSKPKKSWIKGVKAEFKKIIWPDKASVARETAAVIAVSIFLGALIKILDMGIQMGLDFILL